MSQAERRIIEALRTGVPTPEVVQTMGSNQIGLLNAVSGVLDDVRLHRTKSSNGLIFFGDFGSGKSHALRTVAEIARSKGFVVSEGSISRNLKLSDARELLALLLQQTSTREHPENALALVIADWIRSGAPLDRLVDWTAGQVAAGRLASHFALIASSLHRLDYGTEQFGTLIDFLNGEGNGPAIRAISGQQPTGGLTVNVRPWQTIGFLTRLFQEAGRAGWLILLDELELIRLIGTRPTIQRGQSYAGLSRFFGLSEAGPTPGLGVLGCMTSNYAETQLLPGGNSQSDLTEIPRILIQSTNPAVSVLREDATAAMNFIVSQARRDDLQLIRPGHDHLVDLQLRVRDLYQRAFSCTVSTSPVRDNDIEALRVQIRRWITEWDIQRHGLNTELSTQPLEQDRIGDDN